jgi:hypothetical protein
VLIQRYLFGDRCGIAKIIEGTRRAAAMTGLVLEFVVGRLLYRQLRRRLLARAPWLAVRMLWERLRTGFWPREVTGNAT